MVRNNAVFVLFSKARKFFSDVADWFDRHPWVFAVAYLASLVMALLASSVLFGNACVSSLSFMPELSDETIVAIDKVFNNIFLFSLGMGALMLLAPFIPLCLLRFRTAGRMFLAGLCGLAAGVVLFIPIFFFGLESNDQANTAKCNLAEKEEALRQGKTTYERKKIRTFQQHRWMYGNGRYAVGSHDVDPDHKWLVDEKWKPIEGAERPLWENRVLLDDVMQWQEVAGRLHLLTEAGTRYVLDYAAGEVYKYPNAQHCPRSSQSDEVFENLERRLRNGGCK